MCYWSESITWFRGIYRYRHDWSLICLTDIFLCFNIWLENGWIFNKFKLLIIWNKMIFFLSFCSTKSNLAGFLINTRQEIFTPLKQVWSLGLLCSTLQRFCSAFVSFFKIEFNLLPDLLNTRFTIVKIGLFYGGEYLEVKIGRFLIFFWQDGHVYLIGR